jgi:carboxyl-terminal processing protease
VVSLFGFSAYKVNTADDQDQLLIRLLMDGLRGYHYSVHNVDDKFSQEVYDLYLKRIDGGKRYLTKGDIEKLSGYKTKLDDEINDANYEFFEASEEILTRRVQQVQEYCEEILSKPFDFTKDENITLKPEALEFPKDKDELKQRWYDLMKYQTLQRLNDMIEDQEKLAARKDTVVAQKSMVDMEATARTKVLKLQKETYQRWLKTTMEEKRSGYLNAIMNIYDPHTGYFPPENKEDFDIGMSGKLEGIGATLQEKEGVIKVMSVVPGSPTARQGDIKEGDAIIKVAQGKAEPVDIEGWRVNDAIKLIRGKKGTEVRLTIRKPDASTKVVSLIRDVIVIEATYAKSVILKDDKTNKRVGYIYLPKFYADFNDRNGARCSEDVRKELEKLKAENVEGVILDLRNNGGGSLNDVVDMTGYFIEKGPVVQVKAREGAPQILSDRNPALQYDGKLIVMVNQFSASASEILAAAIQDYKRGIIVGTPTYGKGTVQRFFDLDEAVPSEKGAKLGSMKLTTQKFYRINGGATQLKGVTPDIIIPDEYTSLELGEKDQDHYMNWDEIKPVDYAIWSKPANLEAIRRNSRKRLDGNPSFKLIIEEAKRLKEQDDRKEYPIGLANYRKWSKKLKEQSEKFDKAMEVEIPNFSIVTLKADEAKMTADSSHIRLHEKFCKDKKKDVQLYETMQIMSEM